MLCSIVVGVELELELEREGLVVTLTDSFGELYFGVGKARFAYLN